MDRRAYLKSLAVSAGLIVVAKTIAAPIPIKNHEIPRDPFTFIWKKSEDFVRSDGSVTRRTTGVMQFVKRLSKEHFQEHIQMIMPVVNKGFLRVYAHYTESLDGKTLSFDVGDVEKRIA